MISVGQQLGGYTILRRIGAGGMGEVFLAQHRRVARRAAIKALIPELSAKEAVLEVFFKEARNTTLIRHPGIIEILDCDLHEGQAYIVMEFLEGESLGTYLKRNGPLESDLAFLLGVAAQAASAIAAAHVAGIMHRDLKPENIYLHLAGATDPTVSVKTLDFGISKLSREDGGPSKTKSGVMLGSPVYMSPEQCRGVGRPDARSDIYSLGCVLYEALCGQPPFALKGVGELIVAHLTETPKPPIKLVPDVPPRLNALLVKMLAKAADDRPQTMKQVIDALRECARAIGIDLDGALQPLNPVERPVHQFAPAPAPVGTSATSSATGGASSGVPLPVLAPPTGPAAGRSVDQPIPGTVPMAVPTPKLADRPAGAPPASTASGAPAPARPAGRPGEPIGGTLIFGASVPHATGARSPPTNAPRDAPPPSAPANPMAGGTMILNPVDEPPGAGVRAAMTDAGPPRAFVGGTMILDTATDPTSGARANEGLLGRADAFGQGEDDDDDSDGDSDSDSDGDSDPDATAVTARVSSRPADRRHARARMPSHPEARRGHTAGVPPPPWYTGVWQDRPRLILVVGGVVVLVGVVLSALLSAPGTPPSTAEPVLPPATGANEAAMPPAGAPGLPSAAAPARSSRPSPVAATQPPFPAAPAETVQIDIQGVPRGTEITFDGRRADFPLRIARGPQTHRISVRPPGGAERSIDVDGTRDRVIELVVDPQPAVPAPSASRGQNGQRKQPAGEPGHRPPSPAAAPGRDNTGVARKKPAAPSKVPEAITDL